MKPPNHLRRQLLSSALGAALLPRLAWAQRRQYSQPNPSTVLVLPQDHGPHLDYRTEWWYFTGWFSSPRLKDPFGIQITFFRSAPQLDTSNPSRLTASQLVFAHAAIALPGLQHLHHDQIIRRAGSGGSWVRSTPQAVLDVHLPGWALSSASGQTWQCNINTAQLGLELTAVQTQTPWLQGDGGFSRKGPLPEQSSHYITLPHMACTGNMALKGESYPIEGQFWMDHEWSSTLLDDSAQGWDWVGLHGQNGQSLMAFQIRPRDTQAPPVWTYAALRQANGQVQTFNNATFTTLENWQSPRTGVSYPVAQTLELPEGPTLLLEPLFADQELDARSTTGTLYWEGAVHVSDALKQSWGRGYLEMTGYDRPIAL